MLTTVLMVGAAVIGAAVVLGVLALCVCGLCLAVAIVRGFAGMSGAY